MMDITDVFLLKPLANMTAYSSAENVHSLKSSLVIAVLSVSAFAVASQRTGAKEKWRKWTDRKAGSLRSSVRLSELAKVDSFAHITSGAPSVIDSRAGSVANAEYKASKDF
jgi:hypothetical protein